MQSIVKHLGRSNLKPEKTALFICDLQEVFRNRIINMPTVCQSTNTIVRHILDGGLKDASMFINIPHSSKYLNCFKCRPL